jgi:peptide/nickel transport system ATP-binding protein/oligopeptide transport system ATP-binding protein
MEHNNSNLLAVEDLKLYFYGADKVARVLNGISYAVKRGETVCLVGESGCGKTVSALTIMGLIPQPPGKVMNGKVFFRGTNLLDIDEAEMQKIRGKSIGMVFQEPMTSLNPVLTIGDQIGEAVMLHEQVDKHSALSKSVELVREVGIPSPENIVNQYPHQLSGGQRQRIMIALALACNPELVIADEPTTALDVTIQAQILKLFNELQQKRNMSLIYISHDLGVVASIADRIYIMYSGLIVEQGFTKDLLYNSRHPYTRGLLASLPDRSKRGTSIHSIPGTVPDPSRTIPGCPFHPRCTFSIDDCRHVFPELCDYGTGHLSRCPVLFAREK